MSPKPTGRARRALKQVLDARRENLEAPQGACPVGDPPPTSPFENVKTSPACSQFVTPQAADRPLPPRPPPSPPRRPELDAWASSQPGPIVPNPPDPVHPAHLLRPEQWVLLELITTGMNAAATAQEAYDSAYDNVAQLQSVTRRILGFQVNSKDTDVRS